MDSLRSLVTFFSYQLPYEFSIQKFILSKTKLNYCYAQWKASKLLIIPHSRFFQYQETFVLATAFIQLIYVPYDATFTRLDPSVQPFEVVLLLIFLIDICLNFNTAFYNDQGQLIMDLKQAQRHYLKQRFVFDIIGCFPFEYLTRFFWDPIAAERTRFIKLVQLYRFRMAIQNHEASSTSSEKFKLTIYLIIIFICFHVLACFWWMIQLDLKSKFEKIWANQNLMHVDLFDPSYQNSPGILYIQSLRFTLNAVTMPGYGVLHLFQPNTVYEIIVAMFYNLFGIAIVAIYLAKYTGFITNIVEEKAAAELRAANLIRFMEKEQLRKSLQMRALRYMQMFWKTNKGHEGHDRFVGLPKCTLTDLQWEACEKYLKGCPIFQECNFGYLRALCMHVKILRLIPAEIVVQKGEYGTTMYIIRKGYAQVVSDDLQRVYTELGPGASFGEIALFKSIPRITTVVTSTECELFVITRESLLATLEFYPDEKERIFTKAEQRYAVLKDTNAHLIQKIKRLRFSIFEELKSGSQEYLQIAKLPDEDEEEKEKEKEKEEIEEQKVDQPSNSLPLVPLSNEASTRAQKRWRTIRSRFLDEELKKKN